MSQHGVRLPLSRSYLLRDVRSSDAGSLVTLVRKNFTRVEEFLDLEDINFENEDQAKREVMFLSFSAF